jgi:hypothetical protein
LLESSQELLYRTRQDVKEMDKGVVNCKQIIGYRKFFAGSILALQRRLETFCARRAHSKRAIAHLYGDEKNNTVTV